MRLRLGRQTVGLSHDSAEIPAPVRHLVGPDLDDLERCCRDGRCVHAAVELHPAPTWLEAAGDEPARQLRRAEAGRQGDVEPEARHRLDRRVELILGGGLLRAEPDDRFSIGVGEGGTRRAVAPSSSITPSGNAFR